MPDLDPQPGAPASTEPAGSPEPSPIELNDNSLVRIPGQAEPVKYSELYKRFQGDYTRKTTEHAKRVAAWETAHKQQEQALLQREAALQAVAAQMLKSSAAAGSDPFEAIKTLPYVDGATLAQVVQQLKGGFEPITQSLSNYDQVILGLYQELKGLRESLQNVHSERAESSLDQFVRETLTTLGYADEDYHQIGKMIYLAHEGEDLKSEFPEILKNALSSLDRASTSRREATIRAAKPASPFKLPGKGGTASPGKPVGLKGTESASDQADYLWNILQSAPDDET